MNVKGFLFHEIGLALGRDPRSVRKVYEGGVLRSFVATQLIREALLKAGLEPLQIRGDK